MPERVASGMPGSRALGLAQQNWAILAGVAVIDVGLLWISSHAHSSIILACAAILFAFSNNTLFALMHEAVHGNFDPSPTRNDLAGTLCAAFFPTAFTLQRSAHLTHHRNNRSDLERFDYIDCNEAIPLKTAQWFSILTGFYWIGIPAFLLFYVLFAEAVSWQKLERRWAGFSKQTSAAEFLGSLRRLPVWRVRAEFAVSAAIQVGLAVSLNLTFTGWAFCYGAFALAWSSLQYADHAFSRLDRIEGAWNLKVGDFTKRMFLNYHYHLEHHRDVQCHWQDLPGRIKPQADGPRRLLSVLLLMWKGPRLLPGSGQGEARQHLLDRSILAAHVLIFGVVFELVYALANADFTRRGFLLDVALPLDAQAPFIPAFALVYISVIPLVLVSALILKKPERSLSFFAAVVFEVILSGICFLLFPVAPPVPPPVDLHSISGMLFGLADMMNLEGNCMPSLHVALALSCAWAGARRLQMLSKVALWAWALGVCASTWLIHQHWLLDIVGGALVAAIGMALVEPWLRAKIGKIQAEIIGREQASA